MLFREIIDSSIILMLNIKMTNLSEEMSVDGLEGKVDPNSTTMTSINMNPLSIDGILTEEYT